MINTKPQRGPDGENIIGNQDEADEEMDMGMGSLSISKMQTR